MVSDRSLGWIVWGVVVMLVVISWGTAGYFAYRVMTTDYPPVTKIMLDECIAYGLTADECGDGVVDLKR